MALTGATNPRAFPTSLAPHLYKHSTPPATHVSLVRVGQFRGSTAARVTAVVSTRTRTEDSAVDYSRNCKILMPNFLEECRLLGCGPVCVWSCLPPRPIFLSHQSLSSPILIQHTRNYCVLDIARASLK
jgi:hypothetical protein